MSDPAVVRSDSRQGRRAARPAPVARPVDYHDLRNPFPPQPVFSQDRVGYLHDKALEVLELHGIQVLQPEARDTFRAAGALVDDATAMIRIARGLSADAFRAVADKLTPFGIIISTSKTPDDFRKLINSEAEWMGAISKKINLVNS